MPDLIVENLTKQFPTRAGPLEVLRGISFQMDRGDTLAVVGPSGSGKSTLLHILGALEPPSSGRVVLDGVDPAQLPPKELAAFRNQKIGFVFQDACLLPQCTVLENVLIPTLARGSAPPEAIERAKELLDRVGLSDRLSSRPGELSGGQRQRVALARALINRPLLLLADEPTGNLDRTTAEQITELLLELHRQERMILIVVTHSLRLARRMHQVRQLDQGLLQELTGD
ncbi:MAG TPA: ABC transporter ATP-binding protein [Thermoguttaceae bacterium]|nr:ABC transporter ATP-binding protein [Thermoguttaceae bacterium]